ncbi:hypothetical protein [Phreatobacter cathodiphilus]|uniref:Uncharacterized protein n=1 Tax=Phreatobacter cathodiphilus TaxID=1868589 RepID=A0A2S0NFD4_9HYPH|nr:hypothetical protein [Phreatobacter cathodiphilus]AVO46777.1 hypothetical protein C6569_17845 [Phreatobacter cathodiphilus]
MTNGSRDDGRSAKDAPRFDQAQPNQPRQNQSQQNQGGGSGQQQGGFPHENGGWGQAEEDLLRDPQDVDATNQDSQGGASRQRQTRPTGI